MRRTKLLAAFAFSLLAGLGAYTMTYRALVLISQPVAAVSVLPITAGSPGPSQAQTPPAPPPYHAP